MIAAAFRLHLHDGRWWLLPNGIVPLLLGLALVIEAGMSPFVLNGWVGAYAIAFGVMLLILAFRLHTRHTAALPPRP